MPEFFGDVAVVNAKIWPFLDIEPRRYRFRVVNGSQSRFYNMQFADEKSGKELPFTQIGAEGGLLRTPVPLHALLIAPGERADLIVDFAGKRERSFIVTNNARAPYPAGGRAACHSSCRSASTGRSRASTHDPGAQPAAADLALPARAVGHARAAPLGDS